MRDSLARKYELLRTSFVVLALLAWPVSAQGADPVVVHLPTGPGPTWTEIERLAPGFELRVYESASSILWRRGDVVVIFRAPDAAFRASNPRNLAATEPKARIVFVFIEDLERYLGVRQTEPAFKIALGRVIAHELEHVRRQSREHDKAGYFKACLTREDLLRQVTP